MAKARPDTKNMDQAGLSTLRDQAAFGAPFIVQVLASLVRTSSVNPGASEEAIANVIVDWLRETGAEVKVVEFASGRPSVAAVFRGDHDGPTLVLNGHMDTVPIDDESLWTTDPFGAEVKDGYLYGRGACDMKGGLAVELAIARYLRGIAPSRMRGSVVLHFAAGEERGEPGTRSLLDAGFSGDYGITVEPTGLRVATATRGCACYSIRIGGRSIHASKAELGLNPVWPARDVLEVIRGYDGEVRSREHALLPGGSCTPTMIRAGVKENAVPDSCEIVIDRRLLPGETAEAERKRIRGHVDGVAKQHPCFRFEVATLFSMEAAEVDANSPFAHRVVEAAFAAAGRERRIWGAPFGSDVSALVNDGGIEAVTFGPGDVSECHCPDERVAIKEIEDAAVTIAQVITEMLVPDDGGPG